ncbi:MAG: rhodanese-like domain-containing protein [Lachnospiraceae bacterium]|nr:rhodanese-like domain-containing protein [Lachnospiraceae bacterium]
MTVAGFEDMLTRAFHESAGYDIKNGHFTARNVTVIRDAILDRKIAASVIHEFLIDVLGEKDDRDIGPALELADIYDCRVCAAHIAQVYCKGIMDSAGSRYFGLSDEVTDTEAETYIERIFNAGKRRTVKDKSCGNTIERADKGRNSAIVELSAIEKDSIAEKISTEKCRDILLSDRSAILIDVRSHAEYENGHFENAVNIPMDAIIKNPYMVSNDRDATVILWCEGGFRSETTGRCLVEAGYKNVYIVGENV